VGEFGAHRGTDECAGDGNDPKADDEEPSRHGAKPDLSRLTCQVPKLAAVPLLWRDWRGSTGGSTPRAIAVSRPHLTRSTKQKAAWLLGFRRARLDSNQGPADYEEAAAAETGLTVANSSLSFAGFLTGRTATSFRPVS
jgi:hypothetical protein